jgi:hypothetical protein
MMIMEMKIDLTIKAMVTMETSIIKINSNLWAKAITRKTIITKRKSQLRDNISITIKIMAKN